MIDVRDLVNEVAGILEINQSDYTKFKVLTNANTAQTELVGILPVKYLRDINTKTRLNLKADTAIYQWPDDYLRFLNAWVNYSAEISESERGIPVFEYKPDYHYQSIKDIATANYPFIDPNLEGGYEVRPAPSADQDLGLLLEYVYEPPDMSIEAVAANDQDSMLHSSLRPLLLYRTVVLSALVEDYRPELSKEYEEKYDKLLSRLLPKKEEVQE